MMTSIRTYLLLFVLPFGLVSADADDWVRFRGPNGSGVNVDQAPAPLRWSPTQNLQWKVELPGAGVSSPIVLGNRIFVTCYSGYGLDRQNPGNIEDLKRHLVCIDAETGKTIWEKTVDAVQPEDPFTGAGVPAHGYASHTPISDGERVYVFFGKTGALAFDMDGNQLWQTGLGTESDPMKWGSSSSPILYNDLLIVTASAESQALVGLNAETGSEVWRQEAAKLDSTWGTPILVKAEGGSTELVIGVPGEIWGLNPQNGRLRWFCQTDEAEQASTSAVASDDTVYNISGRGGGSIAVRTGGKGDVTATHVDWKGRETSRFGSPLIHNGRLYNIGSGIVTSTNIEDGEKIAEVRLQGGARRPSGGGGGRFGSLDYASPVIADGKLYVLKGSGEMFVLEIGDELRQVAVNRLTNDSESFGGTPAISNGRMFVRSNKHLYCVVNGEFDEGAEPKTEASDADETDRPGAEQAGGGQGRGGGRGEFDPTAFFERMDQNKDGKLTGDEITGPMADRVEQMDKDKDGSITKEEFTEGMRAAFSRGGRDGRGGGGGGGGRYQGQDNRPERPDRPKFDDGIASDK